ncbi:hypothetical protein [Altererythrobacter sp. Root672]|uniref:hypothetical protein n=1 Tax=Altererythrobacter sp. Root672 TaxID=1736584 RepID=UPI0007021E88|nr:hypothetical protein [Altererythrobacter sp. Root672]KRA80659.1 hypothetical protein ASD76_16075 [Altererythrobacter sp. Root672]
MNRSELSGSELDEDWTGLFFSLIDGQVCACWHDQEHIVRLAGLDEAEAAMRHFQEQTKVGERLNGGASD